VDHFFLKHTIFTEKKRIKLVEVSKWQNFHLKLKKNSWSCQLNRVSFNGAPAKYDIRTWSPDHTKMGKGITLSNEEFQVLVDAFKN